jgi:hypothetical protein
LAAPLTPNACWIGFDAPDRDRARRPVLRTVCAKMAIVNERRRKVHE